MSHAEISEGTPAVSPRRIAEASFATNAADLMSIQLKRPTLSGPSSTGSGHVSPTSSQELHRLIEAVPPYVHGDDVCSVDAARSKLSRAWRDVKLRAWSNPEEANRLDRRGRTCLHAACARKPPLDVVKVLIQACDNDDAADNHGRTPLAIAIAQSASIWVVMMLLASNTAASRLSDRNNKFPLHLACCYASNFKPDDSIKLVKALLETWPGASQQENIGGRTPLHMAIEAGAPVPIIEMLVQECPATIVMGGCGATPLDLAIQCGSSLEVFRLLLKANPEAPGILDSSGQFPLWRAIRYRSPVSVMELLCNSREVVLTQEQKLGRTALHFALEDSFSHKDDDVVKVMLRKAPRELPLVASRCGGTSLDFCCQYYVRTIRTVKLVTTDSTQSSKKDFTNMTTQSQRRWRTCCLLLRAVCDGTVPNDNDTLLQPDNSQYDSNVSSGINDATSFCVLHAALVTDCKFAAQIVETALALYPWQARERDKQGRYPLHIALDSCQSVKTKNQVLPMLLNAYPEVAKLKIPDTLVLVAQHSDLTLSNLQKIIAAVPPESFRKPDPATGLFPFMVAASNNQSTTSNMMALQDRISNQFESYFSLDPDLLHITAIFEMLLLAPDLVSLHL
eukprot:CAMPEP_0198305938 /NCGR_PEP_ID=MMETSP1449-20131203/58161_1 /TAXON_ID=420275 /ORGANISM="Attheya septentrionalis, Strain CCMP2084" /LENGTH=621 /DNA_ID=CAMNT_0044008483 /DNA_START=301 /DNA_END=2166 /DNA_ORIENTATION=+